MRTLICMENKVLAKVRVMYKLQDKLIKQQEAANILNVSVRHLRRLWSAYKKGSSDK